MLNRMRILGAAVAAVSMGTMASAASIGFNFSGGNGNEGAASTSLLAATDSAGFVPQTNWNNLPNQSGASIPLVNNAGAATVASVTYASNNTWGRSATAGDGNSILLGKYLDAGTNAPAQILPATINVVGVPYAQYDVYIYARRNETAQATDPGPNFPGFASDYTVQGVTQSVRTGDAGVTNPGGVETFSSFVLADAALATSTIGNYVKFSNVSGATLNIVANASAGNWRSPVDGIQIVQTPEPGTLAFLGLGVAGCLGMRRRRNAD